MEISKYRVHVALLGCFVAAANLLFAFTPNATETFFRIANSGWVGACIFLLMVLAWSASITGVFFPPLTVRDGIIGGAGNSTTFRLLWAIALGWSLAWACMLPHEQHSFGGASMLTLMFMLAWSFAGSICFMQEMPRFKTRLSLPVRFSLA